MAEKLSQSEIDALVARLTAETAKQPAPPAKTAEPAPASRPQAFSPAPQPGVWSEGLVDRGPIQQTEVDQAVVRWTVERAAARTEASFGTPLDHGPAVPSSPMAGLVSETPPRPAIPSSLVMDLELLLSIELGRTRMRLSELLGLAPGSVVVLNRLTSQPVDITVGGIPLMQAEVVTIGDYYGLKVLDSRLGRKKAS